jgi:putative endonuclease
MPNHSYWVYIPRCSDDSYYTGVTNDLARRFGEHNEGTTPSYTSTRRPVTLVFSQEFSDINESIRAEKQIKNWSRRKKEALINKDFEQLHDLAKCKNETVAVSQVGTK